MRLAQLHMQLHCKSVTLLLHKEKNCFGQLINRDAFKTCSAQNIMLKLHIYLDALVDIFFHILTWYHFILSRRGICYLRKIIGHGHGVSSLTMIRAVDGHERGARPNRPPNSGWLQSCRPSYASCENLQLAGLLPDLLIWVASPADVTHLKDHTWPIAV